MGFLNENKQKVSRFRYFADLGLAIVMIVVLLQFAVGNVQSYEVISRSMDPTLKVGDRVLLFAESPAHDLHGKVIAFVPDDHGTALTKRVLAQDGERVDLKAGQLYVNGQVDVHGKEPLKIRKSKTWDVGSNQMFVAGDNRNNSYDSVDHGPVSESKLLGVLKFRYWPPERLGLVN